MVNNLKTRLFYYKIFYSKKSSNYKYKQHKYKNAALIIYIF